MRRIRIGIAIAIAVACLGVAAPAEASVTPMCGATPPTWTDNGAAVCVAPTSITSTEATYVVYWPSGTDLRYLVGCTMYLHQRDAITGADTERADDYDCLEDIRNQLVSVQLASFRSSFDPVYVVGQYHLVWDDPVFGGSYGYWSWPNPKAEPVV